MAIVSRRERPRKNRFVPVGGSTGAGTSCSRSQVHARTGQADRGRLSGSEWLVASISGWTKDPLRLPLTLRGVEAENADEAPVDAIDAT